MRTSRKAIKFWYDSFGKYLMKFTSSKIDSVGRGICGSCFIKNVQLFKTEQMKESYCQECIPMSLNYGKNNAKPGRLGIGSLQSRFCGIITKNQAIISQTDYQFNSLLQNYSNVLIVNKKFYENKYKNIFNQQNTKTKIGLEYYMIYDLIVSPLNDEYVFFNFFDKKNDTYFVLNTSNSMYLMISGHGLQSKGTRRYSLNRELLYHYFNSNFTIGVGNGKNDFIKTLGLYSKRYTGIHDKKIEKKPSPQEIFLFKNHLIPIYGSPEYLVLDKINKVRK